MASERVAKRSTKAKKSKLLFCLCIASCYRVFAANQFHGMQQQQKTKTPLIVGLDVLE